MTNAATNSASLHHLANRRICHRVSQSADKMGSERTSRHLMDSSEHTAPTGASRQVHQGIDNALQPLKKSALPVVRAVCVDRPVNQERPAHDGVSIHKSPIATV